MHRAVHSSSKKHTIQGVFIFVSRNEKLTDKSELHPDLCLKTCQEIFPIMSYPLVSSCIHSASTMSSINDFDHRTVNIKKYFLHVDDHTEFYFWTVQYSSATDLQWCRRTIHENSLWQSRQWLTSVSPCHLCSALSFCWNSRASDFCHKASLSLQWHS